MKVSLAILITLLFLGSFAVASKKKEKPVKHVETPVVVPYDIEGQGVLSVHESGHDDWIDNTSCHEVGGTWHCSGGWEAPTPTTTVCTLRTMDQTQVVLDCADAGRIGLFSNLGGTSKVKYHVVVNEQTSTASLTTSTGKTFTLDVLHVLPEDALDKKARTELCQQKILKGDRCADVPSK